MSPLYDAPTDIPEKAREAPVYGPPLAVRQEPLLSLPTTSTSYTTTARLLTQPASSSPRSITTQPALQSYSQVVAPSRHLTPPDRQRIEPPSRHLSPPLRSLASPKKSIITSPEQQQQHPGRQPSQFGLRMKSKMRFSRSLSDITSVLDKMLPHSIQEEFPLNFNHDLVVRLVEKQMRSKRSINGSPGDNHHHHHHDHHHEEDRGCTILGVYYQLGEVIGELLYLNSKISLAWHAKYQSRTFS